MKQATLRLTNQTVMRACFALAGIVVLATTMVATERTVVAANPSWAVQATPNPTGATKSELSAVSCPSVSQCMAVGRYTTSSGARAAMAEEWTNGSWMIRSVPQPVGTQFSELRGVSCPSTTDCLAVGDYGTGSAILTLAERWDGSNWAIQPTPAIAGTSFLTKVSCSSTIACTAVGYRIGRVALTLAERWDGSTWTLQSTPSIGTDRFLYGVSCPSSTSCTAVGYYDSCPSNVCGASVPLAERWNGTSWEIQSTPPTGAINGSRLFGVSCPSTSTCTAVGASYGNFSGLLAERWNGSQWTVQSIPQASGNLNGISCASTTVCTAVGVILAYNPAREFTLAEGWNGSSWAVQSTPSTGGHSRLFGVSCSAVAVCTAVGNYHHGLTLAERYS